MSAASASSRNLTRWYRIRRFFRQVVAELRKVIWPTRSQLFSYTAQTIVFLAIMVTLIAAFDFGFGKAVFALFAGH